MIFMAIYPVTIRARRLSGNGQADIMKKHAEITDRSVTPADFRAILISLGDDPFVGWRYIYEVKTEKYLDVELLSMTVRSLGLAASEAPQRLLSTATTWFRDEV